MHDGERRDYTLSEYRGQKVVLAFYPGDFTPGCTRQMCSYRDHFDEFEGVEAALLGISPQDVDSHEKWIEKRNLPFPLLADTDKKVIEAYGVGAPVLGVRRSVFVVDGEGIVRYKHVAIIGATFGKAERARQGPGGHLGTVDLDAARDFVRGNHARGDGHTDGRAATRSSRRCVIAVDDEGALVVSTRETALKVKNLRRDPRVSFCVLNDGFYGEWVQVDGHAEIVSPAGGDGAASSTTTAASRASTRTGTTTGPRWNATAASSSGSPSSAPDPTAAGSGELPCVTG